MLNEGLNIYEKVEAVAKEISLCRGFDDTLYAEYLTEFLDLDENKLIKEFNGYLKMIYEFADMNNIFTGDGEFIYERVID